MAEVGSCKKVHYEYVLGVYALFLNARGGEVDVGFVADGDAAACAGYLIPLVWG